MNLFTMNEENNTPSAVALPAKRKRGRPRKDGSVVVKKGEGGSLIQSPTASVSDGMRPIQQNEAKPNDHRGMVGRIVSGVIDGCFDAGYFLSVRIGGNNNGPPLRGVIFEPGRVTPVSSDNDVAPNARLFQRTELPVPAPPDPQCQGRNGISPQVDVEMHNVCSQVLPCMPQSSAAAANSFVFDKQISSVNASSNDSRSSLVEQIVMQQNPSFGYVNQTQSVPPAQSLRMVEQDEMMQVYEVSVQSEGLMEDAAISSKDWISESSAKLNHRVEMTPVKENLVAMEPTKLSSEAKQNQLAGNDLKDSFHGVHQSCLIAEDQPLPHQESLVVMDRRLQTGEMVQNEPPQARIFELHDAPIVDQTPCLPSANQNFETEFQQTEMIHTPTNGQNTQLHQSPTVEKFLPVPTNPENSSSELEPSKLAHYDDLERQNFGILRDLVAGNHHFIPPEVISDHPGKFMMEKPNSPKNDTEKVTQSESKRSDGRKPGSDPVDNNELHQQTGSGIREAMPFDLELSAAEESSCAARPETKVSSPTNNQASLSESDPR